MPYLDLERRRVYAREWRRRRRMAYFQGKHCIKCGSTERLEIHHLEPSQKESNAVWSWCQERRERELAKCVVWCHKCHVAYHAELLRVAPSHGTNNRYAYGCRCPECRAAHNEHNHLWKLRRGAAQA